MIPNSKILFLQLWFKLFLTTGKSIFLKTKKKTKKSYRKKVQKKSPQGVDRGHTYVILSPPFPPFLPQAFSYWLMMDRTDNKRTPNNMVEESHSLLLELAWVLEEWRAGHAAWPGCGWCREGELGVKLLGYYFTTRRRKILKRRVAHFLLSNTLGPC